MTTLHDEFGDTGIVQPDQPEDTPAEAPFRSAGFEKPFTPANYPTDAELQAAQVEKDRRYRAIIERGRRGLQAQVDEEIQARLEEFKASKEAEQAEIEKSANSDMGLEAMAHMIANVRRVEP